MTGHLEMQLFSSTFMVHTIYNANIIKNICLIWDIFMTLEVTVSGILFLET